MKKKGRTMPISTRQYEKAITLCQRDTGATGDDLRKVLNNMYDASYRLKKYITKTHPELELTSESMTPERKKKEGMAKGGGVKVYYIKTIKRGAEMAKSQVEPSNVAPSQVGQEGIQGVGKTVEIPGTDQQAAEQVKSPNPEEPAPEVPAEATQQPKVITGEVDPAHDIPEGEDNEEEKEGTDGTDASD